VELDAQHRTLVSKELDRIFVIARSVRDLKIQFPFRFEEPVVPFRVLESIEFMEAKMGRGLLLWLLGVPIPIIILLWLFFGR
jgi:hypothetical protein